MIVKQIVFLDGVSVFCENYNTDEFGNIQVDTILQIDTLLLTSNTMTDELISERFCPQYDYGTGGKSFFEKAKELTLHLVSNSTVKQTIDDYILTRIVKINGPTVFFSHNIKEIRNYNINFEWLDTPRPTYPYSDIFDIQKKVWNTVFQEHHNLLIDRIQQLIKEEYTNIFQKIFKPKRISKRVIKRYLDMIIMEVYRKIHPNIYLSETCTDEEYETIFDLIHPKRK